MKKVKKFLKENLKAENVDECIYSDEKVAIFLEVGKDYYDCEPFFKTKAIEEMYKSRKLREHLKVQIKEVIPLDTEFLFLNECYTLRIISKG